MKLAITNRDGKTDERVLDENSTILEYHQGRRQAQITISHLTEDCEGRPAISLVETLPVLDRENTRSVKLVTDDGYVVVHDTF